MSPSASPVVRSVVSSPDCASDVRFRRFYRAEKGGGGDEEDDEKEEEEEERHSGGEVLNLGGGGGGGGGCGPLKYLAVDSHRQASGGPRRLRALERMHGQPIGQWSPALEAARLQAGRQQSTGSVSMAGGPVMHRQPALQRQRPQQTGMNPSSRPLASLALESSRLSSILVSALRPRPPLARAGGRPRPTPPTFRADAMFAHNSPGCLTL
ncbi:hypothetical protein CDD83_4795 [Cordyceps sp. RAO-2017]|nr:hypothetical protein CDD83_4795 [Cordyceps sp. RAO-2017]